jgi:hypothetical protein
MFEERKLKAQIAENFGPVPLKRVTGKVIWHIRQK